LLPTFKSLVTYKSSQQFYLSYNTNNHNNSKANSLVMCLESNAKILTFIWCPNCCNVDLGQVASKGTNCKMSNPSLQCINFDFKLDILYSCMAHMVVKILIPFLEFCKKTFTMKVYNMLTVMLDSHYKGLHVCKNSLVGNVP
jgi:hypothetical protein